MEDASFLHVENMNMYDTIEHDMRHSKEYLANIKFNFIEVYHKFVFLKRLKGEKPEESTQKKEDLQRVKGLVEGSRQRIEGLSQEIALFAQKLGSKDAEVRELKEKEMLLQRRVEAAAAKAKVVKEYVDVKEKNTRVLAQIEALKTEIEHTKKDLQAKAARAEARKKLLEKAREERVRSEEKLDTLQKIANQKLVYQYNWYNHFSTLLYKMLGVKVIDVRQSVHRPQHSVYTSLRETSAEAQEQTNEITVKLLAKKKERTVVLTLSFVNGHVHSYAVHRTEGVAQVPPSSCEELFKYCKDTNSIKFFIFESVSLQLC
ncbi:hypothetical protein NECID01_0116 [Nematocida sp. AWRm77]|nr:hypothetical protein NECID01_0116 [Nematocida sp. AWRm77]